MFFRVIADLSLVAYNLLDHPLYLNKLGVIIMRKFTQNKLEGYKNRLRLFSAVIYIFIAIVDLYYI